MKTNSRTIFNEKKLATSLSWASLGRVLGVFVGGFYLAISIFGRLGRVYSYLLAETERRREEREKEAHIEGGIRKGGQPGQPGQPGQTGQNQVIAWA